MAQVYGSNNIDDTLVGTSGNDDIRGFGGNDVMDGAGGNDTFRGGAGHDVYITDGGDTLIEGANQGTDEVRSSVSYVLGNHFENLTLTGTASINGAGNGLSNVITGNAGNNVLQGHAGSDTFFVSGGVDIVNGGSDNDLIAFAGTAAAILNLAAGTYTLAGGGQGTVLNVEHASGSAAGDTLIGNAVANQLSGGAGADTLIGGGGADILAGGLGSDRLVADAGDDVLTGNEDVIDTASDIFEVQPGAGHVTITDFQPGTDKIDLSGFGFDAQGHSSVWTASASAGTHNTVLQFTSTGGAQVSITLQGLAQGGAASLAMSDFIGGAAALVPQVPPPPPAVPGGNGLPDVFVIDPAAIISQHGGVLDILGFEDGLDRVDLTALQLNSPTTTWGGWFYDYGPNDQTRLEFWDTAGASFAVNLVGHSYFQADATDFIL
jgi:Ca2+-binding RTX toxin-like protein